MAIMNGKQHSPPGTAPARSAMASRPRPTHLSTDTVYRRDDDGNADRIYPPAPGSSEPNPPEPPGDVLRGALIALALTIGAVGLGAVVVALLTLLLGGGE